MDDLVIADRVAHQLLTGPERLGTRIVRYGNDVAGFLRDLVPRLFLSLSGNSRQDRARPGHVHPDPDVPMPPDIPSLLHAKDEPIARHATEAHPRRDALI